MSLLDLEALQLAPLSREPFTFTVVATRSAPPTRRRSATTFLEIEEIPACCRSRRRITVRCSAG